jgi:hypothetical protein
MKSTIACMKNDMISNVGVLAAAGATRLFLSPIPDIVVGVVISGLFLKTAVEIGTESIKILREENKKDKKDTPAPAQPQQKHAPKHTFSLKKAVTSLFNRKAANDDAKAPKTEVKQAPVPPQLKAG